VKAAAATKSECVRIGKRAGNSFLRSDEAAVGERVFARLTASKCDQLTQAGLVLLVHVFSQDMNQSEAKMKTGDTVMDLGLYASECCSADLIFDTGDTFLRCPRCNHLCDWELEEEIVSEDEFERVNGIAA
jgi:hypothetical protein